MRGAIREMTRISTPPELFSPRKNGPGGNPPGPPSLSVSPGNQSVRIREAPLLVERAGELPELDDAAVAEGVVVAADLHAAAGRAVWREPAPVAVGAAEDPALGRVGVVDPAPLLDLGPVG